MPLQIGERKMPDAAIIMVHYAGWIVVSAAVLFLARV
jgi:fumarate reductase subunit C